MDAGIELAKLNAELTAFHKKAKLAISDYHTALKEYQEAERCFYLKFKEEYFSTLHATMALLKTDNTSPFFEPLDTLPDEVPISWVKE